jgi:hypothetical protein
VGGLAPSPPAVAGLSAFVIYTCVGSPDVHGDSSTGVDQMLYIRNGHTFTITWSVSTSPDVPYAFCPSGTWTRGPYNALLYVRQPFDPDAPVTLSYDFGEIFPQ